VRLHLWSLAITGSAEIDYGIIPRAEGDRDEGQDDYVDARVLTHARQTRPPCGIRLSEVDGSIVRGIGSERVSSVGPARAGCPDIMPPRMGNMGASYDVGLGYPVKESQCEEVGDGKQHLEHYT